MSIERETVTWSDYQDEPAKGQVEEQYGVEGQLALAGWSHLSQKGDRTFMSQ